MYSKNKISGVFICKTCDTMYSMPDISYHEKINHDNCLFCNSELYFQILPKEFKFNSPKFEFYKARNEETKEIVMVTKWFLKQEEKNIIYNLEGN